MSRINSKVFFGGKIKISAYVYLYADGYGLDDI